MNSLPVALSGAITVGAFVYTISRPWRRLGPRLDIYTSATRARMGQPQARLLQLAPPPPTPTGMLAGVFGPIVAAAARRLSSLIGHRDEAAVALALDRAGVHGVSPRSYAYRQLAKAGIGLVIGVAIGAPRGAQGAVVMGVCCCAGGALWQRSELDRRTKKRRERMRSELQTVCHLLAIYARRSRNLQPVVATICERGRGEVVNELRRVLDAISSGTPPEVAFAAAAEYTPEPAAAGLYRALSLAVTSGGELAETLLAQASQLRDRRRDDRKASAARRTFLVVASNSTLMVLPFLVLIGSGVPYMVLGSL